MLLFARALALLPHGFFNLEFLLLGAIGLFVPRSAAFVFLFLDLLADLAYSVCSTYQFSLESLLASLRFLPVLPGSRIFEGASFLIGSALICFVLCRIQPLPQQRPRTAVALISCIVFLIPLGILAGQNPMRPQDLSLQISFRVVRSPVVSLMVREPFFSAIDKMSRSAVDLPTTSASSGAITFLDSRPGFEESPNLVLIVVESWGMLLDPQLAQKLTAAYDDPRIARRYKISQGTVPFSGLTVPGEARELCQSSIGFGIIAPSVGLVKHCLPAILHARGYEDFAIHGYVGQMFDRSTWYPELGFDHNWFRSDLRKVGLPDCPGAFPGICDTYIANWLGSTLLSNDQGRPRFIYWMTLNSHVPEPAHPTLTDDGVCATQSPLQNSAALCSWFRIIRGVHQSVQQMALLHTSRPTIFVLVGDHAPPFANSQLRAEFSSTRVPYTMLTPTEVPQPQTYISHQPVLRKVVASSPRQ